MSDRRSAELIVPRSWRDSLELPNVDLAIVEPAKIRDYLLSTIHPVGRFKAAFFRRLGYREEEWEEFRVDLLRFASFGEATQLPTTEYRQKYEVRGMLEGPTGLSAHVVSIWIVLDGEDVPRLVTVYPA